MSDKTKPLICVVLVNYNGIKDTVECVKSLKECSYNNIHIIIVDNASLHGRADFNTVITRDMCEIIFNTENVGFAGANNIGIKRGLEIGADYFLILNNDTVVDKNFLPPLLHAFNRNQDVGIATGKIYYYDEPTYLWFGGSYYNHKLGECKIVGIGEKDSSRYNIEKDIPFATGCLWLVSKNTIETVGYICEDFFLYYEDTDYCERVKAEGYTIRYVPQSVIYHKESRSTVKGSDSYQYYNNRNYLFYMKKCQRINRFYFYIKRAIRMLKGTVRGRMKLTITKKVWRDFIFNNTGKCADL